MIRTNTNTSASHTRLFPRFRQKHQKNKRTKPKVIKITRSKNPSNLPPCPPSPLISSFVRISMRLEGNRNYAWRLFIKLIAPSSLILPSVPVFHFQLSGTLSRSFAQNRPISLATGCPQMACGAHVG